MTSCQFSRGRVKVASRTVSSQRGQAGNTMHVNFIGAAGLIVLLKFPQLGASTADASAASAAAPTTTAAATASAVTSEGNAQLLKRPSSEFAVAFGHALHALEKKKKRLAR